MFFGSSPRSGLSHEERARILWWCGLAVLSHWEEWTSPDGMAGGPRSSIQTSRNLRTGWPECRGVAYLSAFEHKWLASYCRRSWPWGLQGYCSSCSCCLSRWEGVLTVSLCPWDCYHPYFRGMSRGHCRLLDVRQPRLSGAGFQERRCNFKSEVNMLVTQSCATLCKPVGYSPPGSPVHGLSPVRNTGVGGPFPSPGDLPDAGIEPGSPAL